MSRIILNVHRLFTIKRVSVWMECFGGDVNRMECGMRWFGVGWIGKGDGGEDVKSGWVGL